MASRESMEALFGEAARRVGYESVEVDVEELDVLKVRWVRGGQRWAHFFVSDYLEALSDEAVGEIAESLVARIAGADGLKDYAKADAELSSEGFAMAMQGRFLERNGLDLAPPSWDEYRRLAEEQGASLPELAEVRLERGTAGGTSPAFRVAIMPREVHGAPLKEQLRWIDGQMAVIARGLRDCHPDAPDSFVEVE